MARVAAFLKSNPGATLRQIEDACDIGSVTKVISEMKRHGFGLRRELRPVICNGGTNARMVACYWLTYMPFPNPQSALF
jgi:hypothetical protein